MNIDGNFRKHGELNISELLSCVEHQSLDDWNADRFRQKEFKVHTDTQTIYLIFDADFRHLEPTRCAKYEEFSSAIQPLVEKVSGLFGYQGWVVRCIVTRLAARGRIGFHADQGFSLANCHRLHIPIITNEDVAFTVGNETIKMKAGEIWEINNQRRHGVSNAGSEGRVHIILDWAPGMTHADLESYARDRNRHEARNQMGIRQRYD